LPTSGDVTIRTLFDAEAIAARNQALAQEIKAAALDRMLVVAVLKGSFIFAADLIRSLHRVGLAPEVEFISLSSYREGTVSSGSVRILHDVESDVRGRNVLLVDDILESGARWPTRRTCSRRVAQGACSPACCWRSRASARCRSTPTSSASSVPICSSSATAWMWRTRSGNCPSWAWWRSKPPMARILLAEDEEALRALTARALADCRAMTW
jgi:hypothetical protein